MATFSKIKIIQIFKKKTNNNNNDDEMKIDTFFINEL